jgi:hypothetical protein
MRTLKQTQLKFDIPDEKSVFYVLFYPSLLLVSYIRTRKRCESSSVIVNRPNSISDLALLIKLRSHTTTTYIYIYKFLYIYIFVHQPIVLPEFSVSVYPSIRPQKLLVTIAWRVSSQSLSLSLNRWVFLSIRKMKIFGNICQKCFVSRDHKTIAIFLMIELWFWYWNWML